MERKHLIHTIEPVFNQDSKVLLLGTFPSPSLVFITVIRVIDFGQSLQICVPAIFPLQKMRKYNSYWHIKLPFGMFCSHAPFRGRMMPVFRSRLQIRFIFFYKRPLWKQYLLQEIKLLRCIKRIVFAKRAFRHLCCHLPVLPIAAWHMII